MSSVGFTYVNGAEDPATTPSKEEKSSENSYHIYGA